MPGTVVMLRNPFRPKRDRDVVVVADPVSFREWLDARGVADFECPTICLRNAEPVLRERWDETLIVDGDLVVFVPLPQGGGGGKNPLRTILMIAVMVAAPYLGGVIAGALGITSTIGISLITAGVGLLGATLVNVLLPPPKPALSGFGNAPAPSPTYSLQAHGNQARLLQPIPVIYGRHGSIPTSPPRLGPSTPTTTSICTSCIASAKAHTTSSRSASRTRPSLLSRRSRPSSCRPAAASPCSRPTW